MKNKLNGELETDLPEQGPGGPGLDVGRGRALAEVQGAAPGPVMPGALRSEYRGC